MFRLRITGDLGFEVWKDVPEYEGIYQESTYGRIKSLERKIFKPNGGYYTIVKERILSSHIDDCGYEVVKLSKDGVGKNVKVHRIIAETFLPNENKYEMVNHKDENTTNNNVFNLEFCDCFYNNNYGTRNERIAKSLKKKVLQFDLNGNVIKEWESCVDIERTLNYPIGTICARCNGKRKSYNNYLWKYKEDA